MFLLSKKSPKPNIYPAQFTRTGVGKNTAGRIFPQNTSRMEYGRLIRNLITNGNFVNGVTGWQISGATGTATNNIATLVGTGSYSYHQSAQNTIFPVIVGHKIYARAKMRITSGSSTDFRLYISSSGYTANAQVSTFATNPVLNTWYTGSFVAVVPSNFLDMIRFVLRASFTDAASADAAQTQAQQMIVVDLTAIYGAGNEPTKEQCDLMFANANGGILIQPSNPVWVEESTTNLIQKPLELTDASKWTIQCYCTKASSFFKGFPAFYLEDNSNTVNMYNRSSGVTISANESYYTYSVYLKKGSANITQISISLSGGTAINFYSFIDWSTLEATSAGSPFTQTFTKVEDDWYKLTATFQNNGTNTYMYVSIYPSQWIADGSTTGSIYVSCPQLEQKAYTTSFVDGTRNAEIYSIATPSGLTPTQGCIRMWAYINSASKRMLSNIYSRILQVSGAVGSGTIIMFHAPDYARWYVQLKNDAGTATSLYVDDSATSDGWHLFAVKWSTTETKFLIDGVVVGTASNPYLPSAFGSSIYLGCTTSSANTLGTMLDEIHITNDYPSDATLLNEYLNNYPAVPYANTVALIQPKVKYVSQ